MATYLRPDLMTIDPAELSDYLLDQGVHARTWGETDGLHIETDVPADALLAAFVPGSTMDRATGASDYAYAPAYVKDHVQHLRDYRTLVRGGGTPTNAQTAHVIADLIDALRFVNSRITGD